MGTPPAAVPSLEKILTAGHEVVAVWTQPDRPSGRGNKLTSPPVKEFALQNDLPVFQPTRIKTPETLELFQNVKAEVAVVVAFGRILPESFLKAFPLGCLNLHFSLLPKYRGAAPVNWAIVNGEKLTGVTTMQMDIGLDTGDILLQQETNIGVDENSIELMHRLSLQGADLLAETLEHYQRLAHIPQNHEMASLAPIMKKADGKIDWNLSAPQINNRIRGFQPFPTSFSYYQGKKMTIWKSKVADVESEQLVPGTVLDSKGELLLVSCGDNSILQIDELQLEGKNRMKTRDFLNGVKVQIGEKLD